MQPDNQITHSDFPESFKGLRVVAFESRMAAETARLVERYGGVPLVAPSMREVPLEENPAAGEFARGLIAGELDIVVFLTGVGVKALFEVLKPRFDSAALSAALRGVVTIVRGPKPATALRALGVEPSMTIPEPNTWREILAAIDQTRTLEGKRIAVQEYGVPNIDLIAGLQARGARVIQVPVYRWALPEDRGPLIHAIRAIGAGDAEVVLFTSATQVAHVLQVAQAERTQAALLDGLRGLVVASIGPVCSAALRAHDLPVDLEPPHPRLGHLIKAAAAQASGLLAHKRTPRSEVETDSTTSARAAGERPFDDHPLMRAARMQPAPYTPVWLMRQAGRYMPEYRRVRERYDFLSMCRAPAVAAEVTVTAVEQLNVDAAIIFADILLPLLPMNVGLHYEKGDGPIIDRPIRTGQDLARARQSGDIAELGFVADAIRIARRGLAGRVPLIGFAGAPFTLASYLIEGGASRQYLATKTLMYNHPEVWDGLMRFLSRITADYLRMQVEAGADLVQLFDSWVGSLGPDDYRRFVLPYTSAAIAELRGRVPVIHFGTVTGNLLELMSEAGGDVVGLDWRVDLDEAWARLGYRVAVQGNLDPVALFADLPELRRRVRAILDQAAGRPGHIFNLGHGILPETPVDHVKALVEMVHEMSRR